MFAIAPASRRRPPRHSSRLTCQVVRERDFRLVADRIENLSVNGVLVTPADPVLTGERLILTFQLPDWGMWVDAEAVVARVIHGRRPGECARSLGLEFEFLDGRSKFALECHLRAAPVVPPGRNGRGGNSAFSEQALRTLARESTRMLH